MDYFAKIPRKRPWSNPGPMEGTGPVQDRLGTGASEARDGTDLSMPPRWTPPRLRLANPPISDSSCPISDEPISLEVRRDGAVSADPAVVLSFLLRSSCCASSKRYSTPLESCRMSLPKPVQNYAWAQGSYHRRIMKK